MKNYLLIIALLLSAIEMAASPHTYLYTFYTNPFPTPNNDWQISYLNNLFIKTAFIQSAPNLSYVPDSGLCIKPGNSGSTFYISHKEIGMHINSITLHFYHSTSTGTTDLIDFYSSNTIVGSVHPHTTSSYTLNYPDSSSSGFKLGFTLTSRIILKSIEVTYTDSNTNPDITLSDRSSVIGSLCATTQSDPLPTLPSPSTQFDFYGWTTSSTLYNSPTASCTNYIPTTSATLYSCYVHYRHNPNETIQTQTLTTPSTESNKVSFSFTPTSDIHLVSACFHAMNESGNPNNLFLSASSATKTLRDTVAYSASLLNYSYHSLLTDGMVSFPANDPITFLASSQSSISCDSLVLSYYNDSQLTPRYYSTPQTNDVLHIHLTDTTPLTSAQTAIDDISYTMTIDDSRYYFFSLPFAVPYENITFSPISGPLPTTYYYGYNNGYLGDWVISRYDECDNKWVDIEKSELQSTGLLANVGYTIGLSKSCTTAVTFRSAYASDNSPYSISTDQPETSLPLFYTTKDSAGTNKDNKDRGWNLIGNPYYTSLSTLNIPANYILIPQPNSTTYDIIYKYAETLTDTTLAPFSSFFFQSASSSITINPQSSNANTTQSVSARAVTATQPHHFNLLCTDPNNYTSCLTILSSSSYSQDYEIGSDLRSPTPDLDITHDGLAIYAAPLGVGDTITFSLPASCTYSDLRIGNNISIPDNWHLNILDDSHLVIEDNTPTDIEDVQSVEDATPTAIYAMDGRLLPTTDLSSLPSGIYILIINGKPHKIITNGQH